MENCEDSGNSLPYIDDILTDDDSNSHPYNLKIFENYQDKNRNIEIINKYPEGGSNPVAPLAEVSEFSEPVEIMPSRQTGMRLVIKGCNSSISIQGLDNRSSITFKRPGHQQKLHNRREEKPSEGSKTVEKPRKGRWKMLTRSLITKSARFERRGGMDERYPKYVLLKNEEEDGGTVKESYPKMFVFKEKDSERKKNKENMETKSEFNFKKSFKNKTKPLEGILAKEEDKGTKEVTKKLKKPLTERRVRNVDDSKMVFNVAGCSPPQGHVFNEIQGIFEDTLKLCHGMKPPNMDLVEDPRGNSEEFYSSVPAQFGQFSCHDPSCCFVAHHQPSNYMPVYPTPTGPRHAYKNSNTQTDQEEARQVVREEDVDLKNLPFGILSSFFPRVVIMKTFQTEELQDDRQKKEDYQVVETEGAKEEVKTIETLDVPQQDLTIKSKMVQEVVKPEPEIVEFYQSEAYLNCENLSSDEEHRTKTDDSEATEYLHYCENEQLGNESADRSKVQSPPPRYDSKEGRKPPSLERIAEEEGNTKDLSLTKIGYKMYDNLTKLSLNREREIIEKAEVSGCGCDGNGTKKSPCNITLESSKGILKVSVPENDLNFQILNPGGADIEIGLARGPKRDLQEKKVVRKDELWHPDDGRSTKALVATQDEPAKGGQKLKVSLADSREVMLSIEMNEKENKREKTKEKGTKEKKIGTDDLELAGGDFVCTLGESYKNLSPRTGQLLRNLQQKLELGEKERQFLTEKINEKLTDQKFQGKILPGVFLLKQISPRNNFSKKPLQGPTRGKPKMAEIKEVEGRLREYYCEECLATMRIFEDQNPSVKSMVDKFETIIQLESY